MYIVGQKCICYQSMACSVTFARYFLNDRQTSELRQIDRQAEIDIELTKSIETGAPRSDGHLLFCTPLHTGLLHFHWTM